MEPEAHFGVPGNRREVTFEFEGTTYRQTEDYFVARTNSSTLRTDDWTDDETRLMAAYRWGSLPSCQRRLTVYP